MDHHSIQQNLVNFQTSTNLITQQAHLDIHKDGSESAVKIAKNLIKKTSESKGDFYLNLLNWRNTPTEGLNSSPAQRLYSRRTKTLIPTVNSLLKPKVPNNVKSNKQSESKTSKIYNRGVKELRKLNKGETVRVKINIDDRQSTWEKAQVQEQVDIRSYKIRTEDGREYRRNRRHIRPSNEPCISEHD
ncbi:hypothetical protein BSL78_20470 [Apostichopus japonicus]|uniref:Uncharacterized protein n=1 Tax=Stichopus japonicus TaxID=307972 RepID=A0A2G8K3Y8_STIJA|nr:hypothetical protein BSL78_20470 [Apostichopus japonicus]